MVFQKSYEHLADELGVMVCIEDVRNAVTDQRASRCRSQVSVCWTTAGQTLIARVIARWLSRIGYARCSCGLLERTRLCPIFLTYFPQMSSTIQASAKRSGQRAGGSGASARDPLTIPTAVGSTRSNKTASRVGIVASLAADEFSRIHVVSWFNDSNMWVASFS